MSNQQAIGQSATALTLSVNGEESWGFVASAERASNRAITKTTLTRERATLNRQVLIEACKQDYRTHFAAIYGKTERLPSKVFEKIEAAVDGVINNRLTEIHTLNAVSYKRAFAFKANDLSFVDRVTLVGENMLTLQEQHLACNLAIGIHERRLVDLEKKPSPDLEREKAVKAMLAKLAVAKNFIEGEIAHQATLA